jgi:hypothetical protein
MRTALLIVLTGALGHDAEWSDRLREASPPVARAGENFFLRQPNIVRRSRPLYRRRPSAIGWSN